MNLVEELNEFIKIPKDCRKLKRAIAIKMTLQGRPYQEIQSLLNVSQSFISKLKSQVIFGGIKALKIKYKVVRVTYLGSKKRKLFTDYKVKITQKYRNCNSTLRQIMELYSNLLKAIMT